MDKNSAPITKTHRENEHNSPGSMPQQSPATVGQDGEAGRNKRKASPEQRTLETKKRRLSLNQDNEAASSSVDTNGVESSSNRSCKRKPADDEGLSRKKMRTDLKDTQQTTQQTIQHAAKETIQQKIERVIQQMTQQTIRDKIQQMTKDMPKLGFSWASKWMPAWLTEKTAKPSVTALSPEAAFETKYEEQNQLGVGGCGSVFAGYRKTDNLPVAIKHVPKDLIYCKHEDNNGNQISVEVAIMEKLSAGTSGSAGTSAPVSLLDWYDLEQELILVMERPVPCIDLFDYAANNGCLQEEEAKTIMKQLIKAAIELEDKQIFHRDIKLENILIETGSDFPRVRLIDFGLSCFAERTSSFSIFYGTTAHIPPEWYNGFNYAAGPTTVWQMGVVLFETLHKKAKFDTTRFIKNKLKIKKQLSENCLDFLETCLARTPEQRPTLEQLQHHPWLG